MINKKSFKTLIIACWVLLIICLVIKLFGGNWFELGTENTKFIEFCNWVDSVLIVKMIFACIIYCGSTYLIICLCLNKKKLNKKECLIFFPLMIIKSLLTWYNVWIPYLLDIIILFVIPFILSKKWLRPLIVIVIVLVLQMITIVVRNMSFDFNNSNLFVVQFLVQIDYYIMLILLYIYNIKYFKKEIR